MLPFLLASLLVPVVDSAPALPQRVLEQQLEALNASAWRTRDAAMAQLSLAPRSQLLVLWDRARRKELSASQRVGLKTAIASQPKRGGCIQLSTCELGTSPFAVGSAAEIQRYRAWMNAFPIDSSIGERRAASAVWDHAGESALQFLEAQAPAHPELARWTDAAARRLRLELFDFLDIE